jgi:hypothetical protein
MTIDDPDTVDVDYTDTTTVEGPEPWDVGFSFNTEEAPFDIEPGQVVTITAADAGTVKVLTVVDVTVDAIDEAADTVTGTAPATAWVEVHAGSEVVEDAGRTVQADEFGNWTADFAAPGSEGHEQTTLDIEPGVGGAAQVFDEDEDSTHRGFCFECGGGHVNTPPAILTFEGPADPAPVGAAVFATAAFSDPDEGDVFSVTVDWGDGTVTNPAVTFTDGIGSISDSHTFATPGVYGMTLTVSDGAGGADTAEYDYAVIYDPAGRKIIASVRVVEGDAQDHLGVNVKLDKKTGEPKGHVRYNFAGSGFADGFDATAIDSMLTFGNWGVTSGRGTVDGGAEEFEFLVTAYDGDQNGSFDAFRFKIWTEGDPEDVIYDTQPGDGNFAFPNRQPTNGDIKVK